MAKTVLLGIDLRTTVVKVCTFDERSGAVPGQATRWLKVHALANGPSIGLEVDQDKLNKYSTG